MQPWDDLIAAAATPANPAMRGIVRLSGPQLGAFLQSWMPTETEQLSGAKAASRIAVSMSLPQFSDPVAAELQWWPTSRSYTGQPLAELHTIGSPPLLSAILVEAYRRGARPAEPGEFTLRAFLAGRLDLLQAEAVLGVIDASDPLELQTALQQLAGGISHRMVTVRHDLLELLAEVEAGLDFVEEHLEFVGRDEISRRIHAALSFVDELRSQSERRMHAGERPRVVLAGLPNAGKSTLFNALTQQDAALISEQAGTTRDYLTAVWTCGDLQVDLIDTAGWENAETSLSAAMQATRAEQVNQAALIVWCRASDLSPHDATIDLQSRNQLTHQPSQILDVRTKSDLAVVAIPVAVDSRPPAIEVSVSTGQGLAEVAEEIRRRLLESTADEIWLGSSAARCQEALRSAVAALSEAATLAGDPIAGDELLAGELRLALDQLGAIVGAVYTDDLLDRIFSKFCIGK